MIGEDPQLSYEDVDVIASFRRARDSTGWSAGEIIEEAVEAAGRKRTAQKPMVPAADSQTVAAT